MGKKEKVFWWSLYVQQIWRSRSMTSTFRVHFKWWLKWKKKSYSLYFSLCYAVCLQSVKHWKSLPFWKMCHFTQLIRKLWAEYICSLCYLKNWNASVSCWAVFDSLQPQRLYSAMLLCPWNSPGKNTGADSHPLLLRDFPNLGIEPWSLALQEDSLLSEPPGSPLP